MSWGSLCVQHLADVTASNPCFLDLVAISLMFYYVEGFFVILS